MYINPLHVLRSLQFLFAVITVGLEGYVASWYNSSDFLVNIPHSIIFLIFVSVFTILIVLPYTTYAPRYFPKIAHKYPMLIAETTTCLFWFGGFIAAADMIRKLSVCRGLVCHSAIGGVVLGAFEFALFVATSYFAIRHVSDGSKDVERNDGKGSINLRERKWWGLGKEAGAERL